MQKNCSVCQKDFKLIPQELAFYEKIGVPTPDECPECRQKRRLATRNEQKFYKYPCAKCKKEMITTVNPDKKMIVYCNECYNDFRATVDLTKV